jgi:hypothetical protein
MQWRPDGVRLEWPRRRCRFRELRARRAPAPRPDFDTPLARLVAALASEGEERPATAVAALLGRLVSDVTGVLGALAVPRAGEGLVRPPRIG